MCLPFCSLLQQWKTSSITITERCPVPTGFLYATSSNSTLMYDTYDTHMYLFTKDTYVWLLSECLLILVALQLSQCCIFFPFEKRCPLSKEEMKERLKSPLRSQSSNELSCFKMLPELFCPPQLFLLQLIVAPESIAVQQVPVAYTIKLSGAIRLSSCVPLAMLTCALPRTPGQVKGQGMVSVRSA